ncbi:MAG: hypothetical protein C4523_03470 [Myxococcales bacterium]|nr:MAG: hypothetical protein C4523_03470 [Myxococcales bacterium]
MLPMFAVLALVACDTSDGDSTTDGDMAEDGDASDGDASDGDMTDGDTTDGDMTDGDTPDGDMTDGDTTDGDTTDGDTTDGDTTDGDVPKDPDTAEKAMIDRFSEAAGTLMVRTPENGLPGPNQPIDFDQGPFITKGLGPSGEKVEYYNFDVMSRTPAPIFALFREGEDMPVEGQLNIVDVIPGDAGYNDFWNVQKVAVPADYVANTVTSLTEIQEKGFDIEGTDIVVNCPIVPEGSTATKRFGDGDTGLTRGWYKGKVVSYFNFVEKDLMLDGGQTPVSDIYVTFNINPDPENPASGPASGFVTEEGSDQTHNVVQTIPTDAPYSPLWDVNIYDNADFAEVMNITDALDAALLVEGAALVNCPIVIVTPAR